MQRTPDLAPALAEAPFALLVAVGVHDLWPLSRDPLALYARAQAAHRSSGAQPSAAAVTPRGH